MGVHIEMITGIIRGGESFKSYGDHFDFSATVIIKDKEAFIMGASGKFSREVLREIMRSLADMGVKRIQWERHKSFIKKVTVEI